jgi:hypothetical protein
MPVFQLLVMTGPGCVFVDYERASPAGENTERERGSVLWFESRARDGFKNVVWYHVET